MTSGAGSEAKGRAKQPARWRRQTPAAEPRQSRAPKRGREGDAVAPRSPAPAPRSSLQRATVARSEKSEAMPEAAGSQTAIVR